MKDKRIFISGGAGVIGNELVLKLHQLGANIFVGDLKPRPLHWAMDIMYRQGDLNHITKEEIEYFKPEIFIHLAATFERSKETYEFWEENFINNISLSNHLMSLLKDSQTLYRVIFASSYLIYDPGLYVFDQPEEKAYRLTESDPIYPRNLTGVAKLNHEIELRFLEEFRKDIFTCVSARIFRGYGRGSRCVISRWIKDLIVGKKIQVYRKEGKFDYIFAGEVAEGLIRLAMKSEIEGVINLGNDNARKVEEVVEILKIYFPEMKYTEISSDIPYESSQANMDLFREKTGWIPEMDLEQTIPMIIEFERNQLNAPMNVTGNVLITSVSKKVPMVNAVKKASAKLNPNIKIFGGDINYWCIAGYFVDSLWNMPKIEELSISSLIDYCQKHHISAIIPSRDGELLYFADKKQKLHENGISVMISEKNAISLCLDKLQFYKSAKRKNIPTIETSEEIDNIKSDLFDVKERYGAGAVSAGLKLSKEEASEHSRKLNQPIFQPYICGDEVSVDMYIDKNNKIKGLVMRRRDVIVEGEARITTCFYDKNIKLLCENIVAELDFYGHIIIQLLIDGQNKYHILECNPRFGGASSLSIAAGLDSFYWFLLEANGNDIEEYPFLYNRELILRQIIYPDNKIVLVQ